jgi:hypothetical protein
MNADPLLPEFVGIFVPLEIMRLEQCGGPKPAEFATASAYWNQRLEAGELDELLYRQKGKTARSASMLVSLIACLAFAEGGVRAFGHDFVAYEVQPEKKNPPVGAICAVNAEQLPAGF